MLFSLNHCSPRKKKQSRHPMANIISIRFYFLYDGVKYINYNGGFSDQNKDIISSTTL